MVSAELALAVPSVVLVLATCLTALALGIDQVRVVDAARVAARAASRGEDPDVVQQLARDRAPAGAVVSVSSTPEEVVVVITAPPRVQWLPALPGAHAGAEALWEPGARP